MKKTVRTISFLVLGMTLVSSCADEKRGEAPEQIVEEIVTELKSDRVVEFSDTVLNEAPPQKAHVVLPIPPLDPVDPRPDRDPPAIWRGLPPEPPMSPSQTEPIYDFVDIEPVFPGGAAAMVKFINDNLQHLEGETIDNQGRVFVAFVVEKDGSLSNIEVLRGISESLDREAKRVVRAMPNWKPGEQGGKIVRSRMRLPITFRLN